MSVSVHKLLIYVEYIIASFAISIDYLSDKIRTVYYKEFREHKKVHSYKVNKVGTNKYVLHNLLIIFDPFIF